MDIDRVNRERRKRGLPPLTRQQAQTAVEQHTANNGSDSSTDFLIGLATGVPMPSAAGFAGAMIHNASIPSYDPSPSSCDTGPSYDSGSSSSSFDGGSSSCGGGTD